MLKIGLTGGIGSGKSTVAKIFESIGIPVYYADPRAKWLLSFNPEIKAKIKSLLGSDVYHPNGRINRTLMASLIFNDKGLLEKVNQIVHPAVHQDAALWMSENLQATYILYEAALLIENGSYREFDGLIVVTAPEDLRIKRVMDRDKLSEIQVKKRIQNQLPQEQKDKLADYLIINDGQHSLVQQIQRIHLDISRSA